MTHATMNRRKALAAVAVAPAALAAFPTLGLCKDATEGGELAALIQRYFEETDAFSSWSSETSPSDEEFDARADATFNATSEALSSVPARTREDALAAIEFLERENCVETSWAPAEALLNAIRGYIEGGAA